MIGYILAVFIGLSLGLMGGGGSILTVPILVYAMDMDPKLSIALSLAIVGSTSLIGVIGHYRNGNINLKVAASFGPIAMLGTYFGSRLSIYFSGQTQLIIFAVIMLLSSTLMLKKNKPIEKSAVKTTTDITKMKLPILTAQAIFVGILTGIVGVGGGFLIVPALVLLMGLPMKKAVGTSLLIITLNTLSGFIGYLNLVEIPWTFLIKFTACSGVGIIFGTYFVKYVSQEKLKKGFALFLVFMGVFILYKNSAVILG